jgi:signal transduction histidine kinase
VVLYVVAAVGFARRTGERRDPFLEALAVGAVLAAAGRLNYAMFPSVLTGQLSAGDAFQLCWLLAVLAGAALDVRLAWQGATQAAVLEERRRIARDLHDGVAQELASVVRNLAYLDADDRFASRSRDAAKRGLVAARQAIAALSGPLERPLHEALSDTVRSVADREGGRVLVAVDRTASAGVAERQAVLLIASEAVTNALRHSGVREVRVELTRAPDLNLRVRDDGRGFDAAADGRNGSFGLRVMAERAQSVGGRLRVVSVPGRGTLVELAL